MWNDLSKLGIAEGFNLINIIYRNSTVSSLNVVTLRNSPWSQKQSNNISHYFHSLLYSSVIREEKDVKGVTVERKNQNFFYS